MISTKTVPNAEDAGRDRHPEAETEVLTVPSPRESSPGWVGKQLVGKVEKWDQKMRARGRIQYRYVKTR